MTLQIYNPDKLDQLALRLFDLAATVRHLSCRSRAEGLSAFALHDKKALEWCAKLEHWAQRTRADLEIKILQHRGAGQRARLAAQIEAE